MAYTQAQLTTFFTNASTGATPNGAILAALKALETQNASGQLTDAQAQQQAIALGANASTAVFVGAYQFFTGAAPSVAGLNYLNAVFAPDGQQAGLGTENRYIAQSLNLALNNATGKATIDSLFGTMDYAATVKAAYEIIVGTPAATAAKIDVAASVAYFSRAENIAYLTKFVKDNAGVTTDADVARAVKAGLIGQIMNAAINFDGGKGVGAYATATNRLLVDLSDDGALTANNANGIPLFTAYGNDGTTGGTPGSSFALKVGVDALVGTANDDTFVGTLDALGATATTINLGDSIDGGNGVDTLNIISNVATGAAVSGLSLTSVEKVNVNNTVAGAPGVLTINAAGLAGVQQISSTGKGDLTVTNIGNATLGVIGVASTAGTAGTAAVASPATPAVPGTFVNTTITAEGAKTVELSGTSVGDFGNLNIDVSGGTNTSLTVKNSGAEAAVSTIKLGGATTTLNINTNSGLELQGTASDDSDGGSELDGVGIIESTANKLATINVTGTGYAVLGSVTNTSLKTVDASTNTGGVSLAYTGNAMTTLKGGAGDDDFTITGTLGATAKIDLGAGDDRFTLSAAPTTGATITGGSGTDILGISSDTVLTASNISQFSSFEVLELSGTGTYNTSSSLFGGFGAVNVAGGTITLNGVAANPTYNVTGAVTALTVALTNATGTTDALNLNVGVAGTNAASVATLNVGGFETLNINSINGTKAGASTQATNAITLGTSTDLSKVVVTGSGAFSLTTGNLAKATLIDAGAATGSLTVVATAAATAAVNVIGGSANDTISTGTMGGTINAGKGGDSITLNAASAVDVLVFKAGDSVYDATTATAGAGNKGTMDTVTNFATGTDKIDLTQIGFAAGSVRGVAEKSVSGTLMSDLTTAASATDFFQDTGVTRGVVDVAFNGNHYMFVDANKDGVFNSGDLVVKFVGAGGFDAGDILFG